MRFLAAVMCTLAGAVCLLGPDGTSAVVGATCWIGTALLLLNMDKNGERP